MNKKYAVLVVDMLNDFVTGALKCDRGLAIVPKTKELLTGCRKKGVPVIFCNDAHLKDGDTISVRGKGKATLSVGGTSKKDRIFITLNVWS